MHKAMGTALAAVGIALAVLGLAIVAILGPDGRFRTGPHLVDTEGVAVVTAPGVISWKNLDVELLAEVPAHKPVFVGIGNSVDVQAYLKGVDRLQVTDFNTPWKLKTKEIPGRGGLAGAPTALTWWRAQSAGLGGAAIKLKLPDETVSAVILSIGSSNLRGLKVTFAYGLQGGFLKGLGLLFGGLGLAWAGLLVRRGETIWADEAKLAELPSWAGDESPTEIIPALARRISSKFARRTHQPGAHEAGAHVAGAHEAEPTVEGAPDEGHEIVYVYVDEDGVEHELTEQEAAEFEVVSEHLEEHDVELDVEPPEDEPVTYFWVDDDGVEHEVSADDLHKFEVLDDDTSTGSGEPRGASS
jgi:hypothetical protein